jgi:hypothetical protein
LAALGGAFLTLDLRKQRIRVWPLWLGHEVILTPGRGFSTQKWADGDNTNDGLTTETQGGVAATNKSHRWTQIKAQKTGDRRQPGQTTFYHRDTENTENGLNTENTENGYATAESNRIRGDRECDSDLTDEAAA